MRKPSSVILLLTQEGDGHIPPVEQALRNRGAEPVRFDLADFPGSIDLSVSMRPPFWQGTLNCQRRAIELETIQSVWWRRPQAYQAPTAYPPEVREFIGQEAYRGLLGVLLGAPGQERPFWVSRPDRIRAAEFKATQLAAAANVGLRVPKTLVTNEPAAVLAFYQECAGKVVCKAVARGILAPNGEYDPDEARFIYTNTVLEEHLRDLNGVRATACLFQEQIEKAMDIRVVIIGKQIFAVEIHTHSDQARVDWRRAYAELSYCSHQIPDDIERKLLQLGRLFHLQYSSVDFILTKGGEYVYLEQNPNGQFMWLEPATNLPLAEAMANLLLDPEGYALWD